MTTAVLSETRDAVHWLTINRPERRNAINDQVVAGLTEGLRAAMNNRAVRAVVLTGAGDRAFCAGGDLKPAADGTPFTSDPAHPRNFVAEFFRLVEGCTLPLIARVNGHALAGGLGLLCACDMAVAADTAGFGTTETRIGLYPMMILPLMQRVLPRRKVLELCITGEIFSAAEALEMGLVNYVVPAAELDARLDWLLARVVDKSPTGIRLGKQAWHAMQDMSLFEALNYAELMLPNMARTEDAKEGFRAFQEKRSPRWSGR